MLQRWLTTRCWRQDATALSTARGAIMKFLEVQNQLASGTEPFAGADRPDTFTYHFGQGRGVRWHDKPRGLLWLCAFDDVHDRGYTGAERLQQAGDLYPDLDPGAVAEPWGTHPDEDAYEWAHALYGALESWAAGLEQLEAGEPGDYSSPLFLRLSRDEDDIWTLVIRRRLVYPHVSQRERWLTNDELRAVFLHLAGHPDELDYEFENPPHPQAYLFAQVHFLAGPLAPDSWLREVCEAALDGKPPALVIG